MAGRSRSWTWRSLMCRRSMVLLLVIAATASMGGYAFARPGPSRAPARRTSPAGGDRTVTRVSIPGRLSVVVPTGWHVLHGWLSDVTDPAPRLAMASFPARLSHHTCECGSPNVQNFPRNGVFVFVWEYLHYPHRHLARIPRRPAHLSFTHGNGVRVTCGGPHNGFSFRDAGRVFQVEVYLGPDAGTALRARAAAALNSLRVRVPLR